MAKPPIDEVPDDDVSISRPRGNRSAVGTDKHVEDGGPFRFFGLAQRGDLAPEKPAEVAPGKPTGLRPARRRPVDREHLRGQGDVAGLERLVDHVELAGQTVVFGKPLPFVGTGHFELGFVCRSLGPLRVAFGPCDGLVHLANMPAGPGTGPEQDPEATRQGQRDDARQGRMDRPSPYPLAEALPGRRPAGPDWTAVKASPEVLREVRGAGVPAIGPLLETLQPDRLEVAAAGRVARPAGEGGSWSETRRSVSRSVSPRWGGRPVKSS